MPDLRNPDHVEKLIQVHDGVTVVVGGVSTWGLRDEDVEPVFENVKSIGTIQFVRVARGKLNGIPAVDDPITVDGESLEVALAYAERDGAWAKIYVRTPDA